MTLAELQAALDREDDGILYAGAHQPGRAFCALEFEGKVRGRAWSDQPITLPDLRPLNDAPWSSNVVRTTALLPVLVALWEWSTWPTERQQRWITKVVIHTVQQIIAELPSLSENARKMCRACQTLEEAEAAARAAAWATARAARAAGAARAAAWAARATEAAAEATEAAAEATEAAAEATEAVDIVLQQGCRIWIEAVHTTEAAA